MSNDPLKDVQAFREKLELRQQPHRYTTVAREFDSARIALEARTVPTPAPAATINTRSRATRPMTITLTTATRIGGAVVASGTTDTYDPAPMRRSVSRGMATYVSRQGVMDTGVPVMAASWPGGIQSFGGNEQPERHRSDLPVRLPWFVTRPAGRRLTRRIRATRQNRVLARPRRRAGISPAKTARSERVWHPAWHYEIDAVRGNFELDTHSAIFTARSTWRCQARPIPGIDAVQQQLAGNPDVRQRPLPKRTQAVLARWRRWRRTR